MPDSRQERTAAVLKALNTARSMELHAIHQYMNQHYNLDDLDYGEFANNLKLIAIDEMRHAEMFAERIKELGGEPTSELADKVTKGQAVKDVFPFDVDLEDTTIEKYNEFLKLCREKADNITARLFEQIVAEEQAHDNYFQNVDQHIKNLGDTYLSKIAGTPGDTAQSTGFIASTGGGAAG